MQKLLFSGRINLKMIRCFLVVAEELHFGRAAERLHMSQPPLSLQIKELETALGFPLFLRDSRNVVLTLSGEMMKEEMKDVFDNIENALSRVSHISRNENKHLNIGTIGSALWENLLEDLESYQLEYPANTWSLHELPPNKQLDALMEKKLDVGIWRCADLDRASALTYQRLAQQNVMVAVHNECSFADKAELSLAELTQQTFIFLTFTHSAYSKSIYNQCINSGCVPRRVYQFDEPQTQLAFVNNRMGIALVPESMKKIPWPNITFIPLKERLSADLFAVYHPDCTGNVEGAVSQLLRFFNTKYQGLSAPN